MPRKKSKADHVDCPHPSTLQPNEVWAPGDDAQLSAWIKKNVVTLPLDYRTAFPSKLPADVASRETAESVRELKARDLTRITTGRMKAWGYSKYALEEMAERAVDEGYIHNDYVFRRAKMRKQLFARLKVD